MGTVVSTCSLPAVNQLKNRRNNCIELKTYIYMVLDFACLNSEYNLAAVFVKLCSMIYICFCGYK